MRVGALLVLIAAGVEAYLYPPIVWPPPPFDVYKTYENSLEMRINPTIIDEQTAHVWCESSSLTCRHLCGDKTIVNDCNNRDLQYECRCKHNGSTPGLQYYQRTMPTFICYAHYWDCESRLKLDEVWLAIMEEQGRHDIVVRKRKEYAKWQQMCSDNIMSHCGTIPREEADVEFWLDKSRLAGVDC